MNNEIKINVPEGMEIDKENSTFECIKFKPKWIPKRGDIAAAGDNHYQIILVSKYIRQSSTIGFEVESLAIMSTHHNLLTLFNDDDEDSCVINEFWVLEEASASEKELFINELSKQGYVYDPNDSRVIHKREKELPKTWEEFCENNLIKPNEAFISVDSSIVNANFISNKREEDIDSNLLPSEEYAEAMLALCQLIQLRDCYNDGWKPDWNNLDTKYVITYRNNEAILINDTSYSFILCFKTNDLRDTFYNNFKDLIEQAKLLL